jgi:hypothetical protein
VANPVAPRAHAMPGVSERTHALTNIRMKNEGQMNGPRMAAHRKVRVDPAMVSVRGGLGKCASFCRVETVALVASPFRQRARQNGQIFAILCAL